MEDKLIYSVKGNIEEKITRLVLSVQTRLYLTIIKKNNI